MTADLISKGGVSADPAPSLCTPRKGVNSPSHKIMGIRYFGSRLGHLALPFVPDRGLAGRQTAYFLLPFWHPPAEPDKLTIPQIFILQ
jgi:hypothetical protein